MSAATLSGKVSSLIKNEREMCLEETCFLLQIYYEVVMVGAIRPQIKKALGMFETLTSYQKCATPAL